MAIPGWAALQCDDGRGLAVGCARLLLPSATERRNLFGARLPNMPDSFSLSWLECGRTGDFKAVHFSSMSPVRADWWKLVPQSPRVGALQKPFPCGGACKELLVPKPFRCSAPSAESDVASAPACSTSDIRTDANPRPA